MRALRVVGCVLVLTAMVAVQSDAGGDKTKGKDDKKLVMGKVKSVDTVKHAFTITLETGKDRMFAVNDQTKFIGPKGGKGDGLKDDRMDKGYEVKVLPSTDGKLAMEVHLPFRKKAVSDKDKK
jgi:hypothetical protein